MFHYFADTARCRDMVFLDQHAVGQADALVMPAASLDRMFLCHAQAGQGLARVHDFRLRAFNCLNVTPRQGGNGGKRLQKIQRRALGSQQRPRIAVNLAQGLVGLNAPTFLRFPADPAIRVERQEAFFEPQRTAQYRRLARDDGGV